MKKDKQISVAVYSELYYKLRYIASSEYRSVSGQVFHLIRKFVEEYERQYGKIDVRD